MINSDDIARQFRLEQTHQEVVQRLTNDESLRRIQQHLRRREAFAVETNLHEEETWHYFLAMQRAGYEFRLIFLCTSDLVTLNNRVVNRHLQGGHFVREDVIRGRYEAGLILLNHFFNEPDTLTMIDSSDRLEIVYQRVDGQIVIQRQTLPSWVTTSLRTHFSPTTPNEPIARAADTIEQVRAVYQQRNPINPTDEQTPS